MIISVIILILIVVWFAMLTDVEDEELNKKQVPTIESKVKQDSIKEDYSKYDRQYCLDSTMQYVSTKVKSASKYLAIKKYVEDYLDKNQIINYYQFDKLTDTDKEFIDTLRGMMS